MPVGYYDNLEPTPVDGLPGSIEVERVYAFSWKDFIELDWQSLGRIFEGLPDALPSTDIARWFGFDEAEPPFLWASVEPSGLQVYGILREEDWLGWDQQFRSRTDALPCRDLT